VNAVNR
jgi:HrpA-like RNA helicase